MTTSPLTTSLQIPHELDTCDREQDWMRKEISHALTLNKKIIPVVCEGFLWHDESSLHASIRDLQHYNACYLSHTNFRGFAVKLDEMLG